MHHRPVRVRRARPAAVCALPASEPADDVALLALPYAERFLGRLSFKFCNDCACLAENDLCEELRPAFTAGSLDSACGHSCGSLLAAPDRAVPPRLCRNRPGPAPCAQLAVCARVAGATYRRADHSYDTPADEIPTVCQACDMGLSALILRTAAWLELAMDYQLQAVEGNGGVIASQLCLERSFETLACFDAGAAEADRPPP